MNHIKHDTSEILAMAKERMQSITADDNFILITVDGDVRNIYSTIGLETEYDIIHSINNELAEYITNKTNK